MKPGPESTLPDDSFAPSDRFGAGSVWADRVGTRRLIGRNQRGVQIPIGTGEGEVNPGELLKLALIGCAALSADHAIARRLGEEFPLRVLSHGTADETQNRYEVIEEEMQMDLADLDAEQIARLQTVIGRAIEASCTVERTLAARPAVRRRLLDADGTEVSA